MLTKFNKAQVSYNQGLNKYFKRKIIILVFLLQFKNIIYWDLKILRILLYFIKTFLK